MNENKSQESLEERLRRELLEEAAEIMAEVESEKSLQGISVSEEMDEKMREQIRRLEEEKKAYEMLSEKDKEALRLGREQQILRESEAIDVEKMPSTHRRKKKKWKVFALVAIAAVMLFALGMTSIGGRPFILDFTKSILKSREVTKVDSTREDKSLNMDGTSDEELFYQEIEETFGITPVKMMYTPQDMIFLQGDLEESVNRVFMLYQYEENIIEYQLIVNYRKQSYGYDIEDELIEEERIDTTKVPVTVKTYQLPDGELEYVAQFEYENVFYALNGILPKEELYKIIENLFFY